MRLVSLRKDLVRLLVNPSDALRTRKLLDPVEPVSHELSFRYKKNLNVNTTSMTDQYFDEPSKMWLAESCECRIATH